MGTMHCDIGKNHMIFCRLYTIDASIKQKLIVIAMGITGSRFPVILPTYFQEFSGQ